MNLNKAIIIGNLTQNRRWENSCRKISRLFHYCHQQRGPINPKNAKQAEFHSIVAWGKLADIVGQYLAKGRLCMVEGKIKPATGPISQTKHWKTEIIAENINWGQAIRGA